VVNSRPENPVAGEFARFTSRGIAAKGRGDSRAPSFPALAFLSVFPGRLYHCETATNTVAWSYCEAVVKRLY